MKKNLAFYSHYCNSHNHWKFKLLRSKFGWAGEGKFWALNNMIGDSENCILNLNKKNIKASIAADLQFSLSELDEYIDFLITECELIKSLDGQIYTKQVRDDYTRVMKEREAARLRKLKSSGELSKNSLKLFDGSL